ncbi:MAG: EamA family transporter [Patescibacteria group bacterium]
MTWFYLSLTQAFLTAVTWLMLKRSQNKGATNEGSLFIYFTFLILGIFGWHLFTNTPFILPSVGWGAVLILGGVIAAVSNLFSMSSFRHGPNVGFSLALSSTQSIWVTIAGVLLFKSNFNLAAILGILVIIIGVFLIYGKSSWTDFKWGKMALLSALVSSLYWILVMLVSRAIPDLQVTVILIFVAVPQLFVFALARFRKLEFKKWCSFSLVAFLAFCGFLGALNNLAGIAAVTTAPNPGYALAIASSNVILATFFSYFFFKSSLKRQQVLATFIIVLGVVLIRLGV